MVKLRSKNQITLPGKVVALAGLKEGDFLNVSADGTRIVITAQEIRERGAGYTRLHDVRPPWRSFRDL